MKLIFSQSSSCGGLPFARCLTKHVPRSPSAFDGERLPSQADLWLAIAEGGAREKLPARAGKEPLAELVEITLLLMMGFEEACIAWDAGFRVKAAESFPVDPASEGGGVSMPNVCVTPHKNSDPAVESGPLLLGEGLATPPVVAEKFPAARANTDDPNVDDWGLGRKPGGHSNGRAGPDAQLPFGAEGRPALLGDLRPGADRGPLLRGTLLSGEM